MKVKEGVTRDYGQYGLALLLEDDQIKAYVSDDVTVRSASLYKRVTSAYGATQPERQSHSPSHTCCRRKSNESEKLETSVTIPC